MRVERKGWGTERWFIEGIHAAAFIHVNRNQIMPINGSSVVNRTLYIERGTCEIRIGVSTLIVQEGSTIHVPLKMTASVQAKFGDVDLIQVGSISQEEL